MSRHFHLSKASMYWRRCMLSCKRELFPTSLTVNFSPSRQLYPSYPYVLLNHRRLFQSSSLSLSQPPKPSPTTITKPIQPHQSTDRPKHKQKFVRFMKIIVLVALSGCIVVLIQIERQRVEPPVLANREAAHTLVALYNPWAPVLHSVSIVSQGGNQAGAKFLPDGYTNESKVRLQAAMDVWMGGLAADEVVYGAKFSAGSMEKLQKAKNLATRLVTLNNAAPDSKEVTVTNQDVIEAEVDRLLQESYERAKKFLQDHATEHKLLTEALMKQKRLNRLDALHIIREKRSQSSASGNNSN